jgi:hypothetical protein
MPMPICRKILMVSWVASSSPFPVFRLLLVGPWLVGHGCRGRVIRVRMAVQLVGVKPVRNATILKVIEKEGAIRRSSEQLQSEY